MTAFYLWEILVNLLESTMVAYLLFRRLTLRNPMHYVGAFFSYVLFSSILISYCNFSQISTTTTQLAVFLFDMLFVFLCFRNTSSEKIFACCLPRFMSIFADQIPYSIALIIFANNLTSLDFLGDNRIMSTLPYLLIEFIFMTIFSRTLDNIGSLPKKLNIFLAITTVVALLISTFFLDIIIVVDNEALSMKYRIYLNSISIFILFFFFAMLFLIQFTTKTYQENMNLAEQVHRNEKIEERNRAVLQSTKSLQKWKHDYSNHLAVIHELLEAKSYDRLNQYVARQREALPKTFPVINTGHHIIDAILTDKYAIAQAEHIAFSYSVVLPQYFPVNDIEITGILGNLLDNAIEACIYVERERGISPQIKVILKPQRNMFHIHVENSSAGSYRYHSDGQLKTTKKDAEHHGSGLSNVREIVETHSGFCSIAAESDSFTVDVYIPLPIKGGDLS